MKPSYANKRLKHDLRGFFSFRLSGWVSPSLEGLLTLQSIIFALYFTAWRSGGLKVLEIYDLSVSQNLTRGI